MFDYFLILRPVRARSECINTQHELYVFLFSCWPIGLSQQRGLYTSSLICSCSDQHWLVESGRSLGTQKRAYMGNNTQVNVGFYFAYSFLKSSPVTTARDIDSLAEWHSPTCWVRQEDISRRRAVTINAEFSWNRSCKPAAQTTQRSTFVNIIWNRAPLLAPTYRQWS